MDKDFFRIKIDNGIAVLTIDREEKLNALSQNLLEELSELLAKFKNDPTIKVIIITGAGNKAFAAGADLTEISGLDIDSAKEFANSGQTIFNKIEFFPKPIIAAVNGYALGGGCELALACHIRIGSENSCFGQPEVKLGLIPGYGGTKRLAKLINSGRALEYILTGENITAEESYRIGLINKIVPSSKLLEESIKLANKIMKNGSSAVSMGLMAVTGSSYLSAEDGMILEAELFSKCCVSDEAKEGISAFLEKRKPNFNE